MREETSLTGDRLIKMILLMTLADSSAVFQGTKIQKMQVQKYISRPKEPRKRYHRRSTFGVGLDGEKWVNYLEQYSEFVQELMNLTRNKRRFYQQGYVMQPLFILPCSPLCHPPRLSPSTLFGSRVQLAMRKVFLSWNTFYSLLITLCSHFLKELDL